MRIIENTKNRMILASDDEHLELLLEIEEEKQHGNLQTIIKFSGAGASLYLERFLKQILKIDFKTE